MSDGLLSEYTVLTEQAYRRKVAYPAAERRAAIERELSLVQHVDGRPGHPLRWLTQGLRRVVGRGHIPAPAGPTPLG